MRFYYGDKMLLRLLDEVEFWKRQETEHTVVIRQIVPNLEPQFVTLLQDWEQALSQTEASTVKFAEAIARSSGHLNPAAHEQILQLGAFALQQSQQFVMALNQMVSESAAIRANLVARVVIGHIIRESQYFIGVVQAALTQCS